MFCNNCGRSVKEGQRFCTGCGKKMSGALEVKCEKCGATVEEGAKFCNLCGTRVLEAGGAEEPALQMFCPYCGERFDEQDLFCKRCGRAKSRQTQRPRVNRSSNSSVSASKQSGMAKSSVFGVFKNIGDALVMNDTWRKRIYLILALFFVLCAILVYVPVFKMEMVMEGFFTEQEETVLFSMGAPFSDRMIEKGLKAKIGNGDFEVLNTVFGIGAFVAWVVPFIVAAVLHIVVFIKGTHMKHRRFIYQKIVCIYYAVSLLVARIFCGFMYDEKTLKLSGLEDLSVGFVFGGVFMLLLLVALTAFQFWFTHQTKKAEENNGF